MRLNSEFMDPSEDLECWTKSKRIFGRVVMSIHGGGSVKIIGRGECIVCRRKKEMPGGLCEVWHCDVG